MPKKYLIDIWFFRKYNVRVGNSLQKIIVKL